MKSSQIQSKNFLTRIKKMFWVLGSRAFLLILILILIDFAIAGFIFFEYVIPAELQTPSIDGKMIKFDEKTYNEIINKLIYSEPSI